MRKLFWLFVPFALFGCQAKAPVTVLVSYPATPPKAGFYRNSGEGFTFDLPESWKSVQAGKGMDPSSLFAMASPGSMFGISKSIDKTKDEPLMRLYDTSVRTLPTDAPVMVKVELERVKDGANLKEQADAFEAAVYDVIKAKRTTVDVPAGQVTEFTATRKLITGDLFYFVDCVAVDKDKVIRFRFCGNEPTSIKKAAEECMKTLRPEPSATTQFQVEKDQLQQAFQQLGSGNAGDNRAPWTISCWAARRPSQLPMTPSCCRRCPLQGRAINSCHCRLESSRRYAPSPASPTSGSSLSRMFRPTSSSSPRPLRCT